MATVQGAELLDVIVDGGESAKSMRRPGPQQILSLVEAGAVQAVIVAKLDRLTRSVKDLLSPIRWIRAPPLGGSLSRSWAR